MFALRPLASAMAVGAFAVAVVAGPTLVTAPASATPASLPQVATAQAAASWLASQLGSDGAIPSTTVPGTSDLVATANAVLALAAAGDVSAANAALNFMKGQVDPYVTVSSSDGPGQLAILILGAHALGADPRSFGGTDLVSRLLATRRTSGPDAGLFGVQDPTYDGAFRQGLALAALAAAGVTSGPAVAAAESWLEAQQCPDGGWTSYINAFNPCNGDPASYEGPDTNSTALAVEGLAAQRVLSAPAAALALGFLTGAQDSDGGWGYEPNAASAPGSTDPDSTGLVLQGLLALGASPTDSAFQQGSNGPVSSLLSFVISSGTGAGAFSFPGITGPNTLATYQALPAVAGVVFPFIATTTVASVPAATSTGNSVTYSAVVTGGATAPAGSVTFTTGSLVLCTVTTLTAGRGSCTSSAAPTGTDVVTATFAGGEPGFGLSSSTTTLTVSRPVPPTSPSVTTTAIAGATTPHTGKPFAGLTRYAAVVGGTGGSMSLVGLWLWRRSRPRRVS